jgi:tetratricopeptide (TPR) repeat protein
VRLLALIVLVVAAVCSRLVTIAGHAPAAFQLLQRAGTCANAGPLFLRAPCGLKEPRPDAAPRCDADDDVHGCYLAALLRQARGDGEADVSELRRVAQAGYRRPYANALLAYNLRRRGEPAESAAVWRSCGGADCEALLVRAGTMDACGVAASLSDGSPPSTFCLGTLTRQAGRFDDAMAWFRRALEGSTLRPAAQAAAPAERDVSRAEVLYRMGEIELARGRLAEARRLTSECLAADPQHYWGVFQWALLLARDGDSKGGIQQLERLIAMYPTHGSAMLNLGFMHESIGDNKTAEYWFLEARKMLPDPSLADAPLERVRKAGAL